MFCADILIRSVEHVCLGDTQLAIIRDTAGIIRNALESYQCPTTLGFSKYKNCSKFGMPRGRRIRREALICRRFRKVLRVLEGIAFLAVPFKIYKDHIKIVCLSGGLEIFVPV